MRKRDLLTAVILDWVAGDPEWLPHPVRGVGWLATHSERFWRWSGGPERLAGLFLWCTVSAGSLLVVRATLPWATIYWSYALLACRDLDVQSTRVIDELRRGD